MPFWIRSTRDLSTRTRIIFVSVLVLITILLLQPYHHILPSTPFSSISSTSGNDLKIEVDSASRPPSSAVEAEGWKGYYPMEDVSTIHEGAINQERPKRVAIVGAGASGTSAAFFLRRAARVVERRLGLNEGNLLGEIVVFEKEGYVGGRSTVVYPHGDERLRWQELGGSIFVDANKNMMRAAKHFNLTLIDPSYGQAGLGVWDGTQFLFTTSGSDSTTSNWLDSAKALWRYGPLSPMRTKSAVKSLVDRFLRLYDPVYMRQRGAVSSVEDFAENLELGNEYTTRTGEDWAHTVVKVGDKWLREIMGGSTRVNYATDIHQIHALGAGVSMATSGASQIEGGNYQVFRNMLDASGATVHLGTEITDIIPLNKADEPPLFHVQSNKTEINDEEPFDAVFFAAPWGSSRISKKIAREFDRPIPSQPYVHLHVTYLTTSQPHPQPSFFGLPEGSFIPNMIITASSPKGSAIPPARFQSISWHGETYPGSKEYAVKIFSLTRLNERFLLELLGEEPSWLLRKEWDSYPKLRPINAYAPVQPMNGFHYLAAQEAWVSTMETQTISGREAVARTVREWWGLGLGECEDGESWEWTCS
ncbi:prenylcysteine oxidase/farnesylcysteine lyase [Kwoniella heveanensis CBS 569]|uniref:Prenylcysteine oxidase/farnesylcysteine lyase n=1 Tax=Kwoniella heveanensis BCC8398 TaxID=1296120 RepID=A0A1B9GYI6_9TREE|nr:prenylcysteine oxidase/farnesylcysteine lyase [Kwoniella heveanensis BCC8398]OCF40102.1 prenylcysteine oxidase/farnesylcysteine lyase [Kwoniella heveanensis CBS 569]